MCQTVIFSEKPALSRNMAPALAAIYDPASTLVVHLMLAGPGRFAYRRGVALSEYPLISPPAYRLDTEHPWRATPLHALLSSTCAPVGAPEALAAIRDATRLVLAGAAYGPTALGFKIALELIRGPDNSGADHPAHILVDLSPDRLVHCVTHPGTVGDLACLAGRTEVKRYFEWNWNSNAHVVLGRVLRAVPGVAPDAVVSKFGLQLLYWSREAGPVSDGAMVWRMTHWVGTGKHAPAHLGSCTSYATIIEQLQAAQLLSAGRRIALTQAGERLLSQLHPGCQDADLPARLEAWQAEGLEAARGPMDRYIRTVFGRQMKFKSPTPA
jgi:hypothetical protein